MPDMAVTTDDLGLMCHSCLSNIISLFDMTVTAEKTLRFLLGFNGIIRSPEGEWAGTEQDKCND